MEELTKQLEAINKTLESILQRLPYQPVATMAPSVFPPQYHPYQQYPWHPFLTTAARGGVPLSGNNQSGVATSGYIQTETGHG